MHAKFRMPRMPEAKIVIQSQLEEYLGKLNDEEWTKYIKVNFC